MAFCSSQVSHRTVLSGWRRVDLACACLRVLALKMHNKLRKGISSLDKLYRHGCRFGFGLGFSSRRFRVQDLRRPKQIQKHLFSKGKTIPKDH